jgi:hypothetical protein
MGRYGGCGRGHASHAGSMSLPSGKSSGKRDSVNVPRFSLRCSLCVPPPA